MAKAVNIWFDQSGRQFISLDLHGTASGRVVVTDFDVTDDVLDFSKASIDSSQFTVTSHIENGVSGVLIRFDFDNDGAVQSDESLQAELFLVGITVEELEAYREARPTYGTKQYQYPVSQTESDSPTVSYYYDNIVAPINFTTSPFIQSADSGGFSYLSTLGGVVQIEGRDLQYSADPVSNSGINIVSGVIERLVAYDVDGHIIVDMQLPPNPTDAFALLEVMTKFAHADVAYHADPTDLNASARQSALYELIPILEASGVERIDASGLVSAELKLGDNGYFNGARVDGDDYNDVLVGSEFNDILAG